MRSSPAPRVLWPTALALICLLLIGCRSYRQPAVFNLHSVNVASLPPNWPPGLNEGPQLQLTPAEREVYDERGRPYCFRARWDSRGELTWGAELRQRFKRHRVEDIISTSQYHGEGLPFEISWIYPAEGYSPRYPGRAEYFQGEEVIFLSDNDYEVTPVTPKLGIIIDNGDPEHRREPEEWRGHIREAWIYYQRGRIFHFMDDQLVDTEVIPTMGTRVMPEI